MRITMHFDQDNYFKHVLNNKLNKGNKYIHTYFVLRKKKNCEALR